MKDANWLKEAYLLFLNERQANLKALIENLHEEERIDEAILEKIKLNIVEIFSKMFNISISNNCEALKEKYLGYFDKITSPWRTNKLKAIEFDREQEIIIENIKIQEADELKSKFLEYYNQGTEQGAM